MMAYKPPPELKSRIESIKKKFEVVEPSNLKSHTNEVLPNSSDKNCQTHSRNSTSKRTSVVIDPKANICTENASNKRSKEKLKATSSYSGKGNIRRTPAFRCDKPVLSRPTLEMERKYQSVVNNRVKLFEDQHHSSFKKPLITEKRVEKDGCSKKEMPHDIHKPVKKITEIASIRYKEDLKKISSVHLLRNHNEESSLQNYVSAVDRNGNREKSLNGIKEFNCSEMKCADIFSEQFHDGDDPETKVSLVSREVNCSILREDCIIPKCSGNDAQNNDKIENNFTSSLKAALKAPLPTGPPPKKPPRTFIHNSPDKRDKSVGSVVNIKCIQDNSSNLLVERKKLVERSITEPHEMLKKLETVLLQHQQGIGSVVITPKFATEISREKELKNLRTDVLKEELSISGTSHLSNIAETKSGKDMLDTEMSVGCFESLICVSNTPRQLYEKLNETQSEFFVESPLCSRKNGEVCKGKNNPLKVSGVGRRVGEEHIYAQPYACVDVETLLRAELSLKENKEAECAPSCSIQPLKVIEPNFSTLHYMCSPINPLDRMDALLNSNNAVNTINENDCNNKNSCQIKPFELKKEINNPYMIDMKSEDTSAPQKSFLHSKVISKTERTNSGVSHKLDRSKLQLFINQAFGSPLHDSPVASLDSSSSDESSPTTPDEMNPPLSHNEGGSSKVNEEGKGAQCVQHNDDSGENSLTKNQNMTKLTEERKVYVRRVSSRVFSTRQRLSSQPFSHLFHCIMLIGLNLDGEKRTKVPYIKSKYPVHASVPPLIEHLCFPDAADWPPRSSSENFGTYSDEQCYSLVVTNEMGDHMFGYCRRVMPEGMDICLPLAYCILSPFRAKGFYFKILSELESQHGQPEWLQKSFIKELYACEFPKPGQTLKLSSSPGSVPGSVETALENLASQLRRPLDSRLEEHDLTVLFSTLPVPILLQVFGSILLERKVLFISNSLCKLSSSIEALHSILYPFSWQYTFIPVLPSAHIGVCEAPTPFIIGLLKDKIGKASAVSLEEGIIVDLEESKITQCVGDESTILPSRLKKCLKMALHLVESTTQEKEPARNVLISEAFVRMFVEICGHYSNHIVTQQDGKKVFEKESFVKAVAHHSEHLFLEWFTETAMFSFFIESRLHEGSEAKGLFEQRAMEHSEEMDKNTMLFRRNYKAINKKVKSFGDRLKDWTPFT